MKDQDKYKKHSDLVWNIANLLRGPYRPPQYRKVMIPLTVLRRLDCVLEETKNDVIQEHAKLSARNLDTETIEKTRYFCLRFSKQARRNFRSL